MAFTGCDQPTLIWDLSRSLRPSWLSTLEAVMCSPMSEAIPDGDRTASIGLAVRGANQVQQSSH